MTIVAEKPTAPAERTMLTVVALLLIGAAALIGWRLGAEAEQGLRAQQAEVFSPEAVRLQDVAGLYESSEVFSPEAARLLDVAGLYQRFEVFSPEAFRLQDVAGLYQRSEVFSPEAARFGISREIASE